MSNDIIQSLASSGAVTAQTQIGNFLHEPLRRFAPVSRAVAKCKRDLATFKSL